MGNFSWEKFNVTLDCFRGRLIGTLVDSIRGNPDVRPLRTMLGGVRENLATSLPLKNVPAREDLTHIQNIIPIGPTRESTSKRHLDQLNRFCRADGRYRQTDRQTTLLRL